MKVFVLSTILLILNISYGQTLKIGRLHPHGYDPGNYEIAASIDKSQVDRGDSISISAFITGYGKIGGSKIYMTLSSSEIVDGAYATASIGRDDNGFFWGAARKYFNAGPFTLTMGSATDAFHIDTTMYFDVDSSSKSLAIATEDKWTNAPIEFHLKIGNTARPDNYSIKLYLTYFNGVEWRSSTEKIEFRINSWLQTHEFGFQIALLVFAIIGIIPGFVELIRLLNRKEEKTTGVKKKK